MASNLPAIPTYPARPIHGGDLEAAAARGLLNPRLYGNRAVEPKFNGFRILLDRVTGMMWNRHGDPLSLAREFTVPLESLMALPTAFPRFLDCEGLERRHGFMRGSLIVLDAILPDTPYELRREILEEDIPVFDFSHVMNVDVLCLAPRQPLKFALDYYDELRAFNGKIGATGLNSFFEGVILKKVESTYPMQRTNPRRETTWWTKYKWEEKKCTT